MEFWQDEDSCEITLEQTDYANAIQPIDENKADKNRKDDDPLRLARRLRHFEFKEKLSG